MDEDRLELYTRFTLPMIRPLWTGADDDEWVDKDETVALLHQLQVGP